jgi:cell division protein FtsA
LAVFYRGSLRHTAVLPVAGDHITSDIAFGLRTPLEEAERLKVKYGCALASLVSSDESFEVSPVSEGQRPRVVSRRLLAEIIEPRVEEILRMVNKELEESGYLKLMPAGIVLTGGTALMEGIVEMATDLFDLPARRGYPRGIGGLVDIVQNPQYATAVGLVIYGARKDQPRGLKVRKGGPGLKRRLKEIFREMFSS